MWRVRTRGRRVTLLALACAALAACALPPTAAAATTAVQGISDQNLGLWSGDYQDASTFAQTAFPGFFAQSWVGDPPSHLRYARFVTAPDTVAQGGLCQQNLYRWYTYVTQTLHLVPVIAVWDYPEGGCADNGKPSTSAYTAEIDQLLAYLDGLGGAKVGYVEAWNEPNSDGVSADQAAAYWLAADSVCATAGCTAIAGDLVDNDPDQGSQSFAPGCSDGLTFDQHLATYERSYVAALGDARPAVWGLHPYYAVNCEQSASVATFEQNLPSPSGQVWFTEVGAWECVRGQTPARGPDRQQADASYLVNDLMVGPQAPAQVFWYELAPPVYTQLCSKYADSALYEATQAPGLLYARPAAATVFGADSSLAATTGGASDARVGQATLAAGVTPGGIYDASYHFDYGPTAAYGAQTPSVPLGSSLDPASVSATVTGLAPGVPYHYRVVVTDGLGAERDGADAVMTPPAVGVGVTMAPAGGTVTVTWSGVTEPSAGDWVGLAPIGGASPVSGFYLDSCGAAQGATPPPASGSCPFTMPNAGGAYALTLWAAPGSAPLALGGEIDVPALAATPTRALPGDGVTVSWAGVAAPDAQDWIGFSAVGGAVAVSGVYAGSCAAAAGAPPAASGSCALALPSLPGSYVLSLYGQGGSGPLTAPVAITVRPPPAPTAVAAPLVVGTARSGRTVACAAGTWTSTPTGFAYAWLRDGRRLAGARGATLRLTGADAGHRLACSVAASNAGGSSAPVRSPQVAVRAAAPVAVLLGARVDPVARSVTVRFRSRGVASQVRCALVRSGPPRYAPCRSPRTWRGLVRGAYAVYVQAVGPGGGSAPAVYRFVLGGQRASASA
jgi:hypothetical protein